MLAMVGASPSAAEDAAMRGDEVVAREVPGNGGSGVAVLRGSDRVELVSERDGWSEIRLGDGRRAWVPTDEIVRLAAAPAAAAAASPRSDSHPTPLATPQRVADVEADGVDAESAAAELRREVARLRQVADDLAEETRRHDALAANRLPEGAPWVIAVLALAVGLLLGSALERRRGRRERSLRF